MNHRTRKKLYKRCGCRTYKTFHNKCRSGFILDTVGCDYAHNLPSLDKSTEQSLSQIVDELRKLAKVPILKPNDIPIIKVPILKPNDIPIIEVHHDMTTDLLGASNIHETIRMPLRLAMPEHKGTFTGVPINVTILKSRINSPKQGVMSFVKCGR